MKVLILLLCSTVLVKAATLDAVKLTCDAAIITLWPALTNIQFNHFNSNGRCWQSPITHTNLPTHTLLVEDSRVPDNARTKSISDETQSWDDKLATIRTTALPFSIECFKYKSPTEHGAIFYFSFVHERTKYTRCRVLGNESYFEHDWTAMVEKEEQAR